MTLALPPSHLKRPVCAITGLPAKYRDPLTGVPYANAEAFQILRRIAAKEIQWDNALLAYREIV